MFRTLATAVFFALWSSLPASSGSQAWTGPAVCLGPIGTIALL